MLFKKLERRATTLVAVALAVAFAAAWSCASSSASSLSGTVTFDVSTDQTAGWTAVIKDFEAKYPGVTVTPDYIPILSFQQDVAAQFAAGEGPDVLYTQLGSAYTTAIQTLASKGELLNISNSPDVRDIPASLKYLGEYDGKTYGIPIAGWTEVFAYNAKRFKQLGLQPPATMKQLLSLCGSISKKKLTPIAMGTTTGDLVSLDSMLAAQLVQQPDPNWVNLRNENKVTFAGSKQWRATFQTIVNMKKAKCFNSGVAGMSRASAISEFVSGKALIYPLEQPVIPELTAAHPKFKWDVFATPTQSASVPHRLLVNFDPLISVNAKAQNPAAALAFLNFAGSSAETAKYAQKEDEIGLTNFVHDKVPNWLKPVSKYMFEGNRTAVLVTSEFKGFGTTLQLISDLPGLLTGQQTVSGLLKALDSDYGQATP